MKQKQYLINEEELKDLDFTVVMVENPREETGKWIKRIKSKTPVEVIAEGEFTSIYQDIDSGTVEKEEIEIVGQNIPIGGTFLKPFRMLDLSDLVGKKGKLIWVEEIE